MCCSPWTGPDCAKRWGYATPKPPPGIARIVDFIRVPRGAGVPHEIEIRKDGYVSVKLQLPTKVPAVRDRLFHERFGGTHATKYVPVLRQFQRLTPLAHRVNLSEREVLSAQQERLCRHSSLVAVIHQARCSGSGSARGGAAIARRDVLQRLLASGFCRVGNRCLCYRSRRSGRPSPATPTPHRRARPRLSP